MKFNVGFLIEKFSKILHPAALRDSQTDKTAKLGSGTYCTRTTIARYSYMGDNCVAVNAEIGPFCSIASYCCIGGGAHPTNLLSSSPVFYEGRNAFRKHFSKIEFEEAKPVNIGADVWIGEKVFIKDGIKIGVGAVVGAQSIVTHDVPPYAIVGGVPAKIIRYRFDEETMNALLESEWWKLPEEKLKQFSTYLQDKQISKETVTNAINQIIL